MKKAKLMILAAVVAGTVLDSSSCLNSFWNGLWNTGFPSNNLWINLGLDALNEVVFG